MTPAEMTLGYASLHENNLNELFALDLSGVVIERESGDNITLSNGATVYFDNEKAATNAENFIRTNTMKESNLMYWLGVPTARAISFSSDEPITIEKEERQPSRVSARDATKYLLESFVNAQNEGIVLVSQPGDTRTILNGRPLGTSFVLMQDVEFV